MCYCNSLSVLFTFEEYHDCSLIITYSTHLFPLTLFLPHLFHALPPLSLRSPIRFLPCHSCPDPPCHTFTLLLFPLLPHSQALLPHILPSTHPHTHTFTPLTVTPTAHPYSPYCHSHSTPLLPSPFCSTVVVNNTEETPTTAPPTLSKSFLPQLVS